MARDDMHVVMYKILAYLYDCMKKGIEPRQSAIAHDSDILDIPERYWKQIMMQLVDRNLVAGIAIKRFDNEAHVMILSPYVTLEGVQFMQENSMMAKAQRFLKSSKEALPFI